MRTCDLPISAVEELALSASLKALHVGERGWITLSEARALFSWMDDQYTFREMNEQVKASPAAFAAQNEHRSTFKLMPAEGRVCRAGPAVDCGRRRRSRKMMNALSAAAVLLGLLLGQYS